MYSLQEAAKDLMENMKEQINTLGEDVSDYLKKKILHEYEYGDYLRFKLQKLSLVRINFDANKVMTITKDAKITVPDMIGNIGGTLGVFIGFSFLGLLDSLLEFLQYLMRKKWIPKFIKPKDVKAPRSKKKIRQLKKSTNPNTKY